MKNFTILAWFALENFVNFKLAKTTQLKVNFRLNKKRDIVVFCLIILIITLSIKVSNS